VNACCRKSTGKHLNKTERQITVVMQINSTKHLPH